MDYDLSRIDCTICGTTYPDTLRILPATEPKQLQKFAVGDKNGVMQCLIIKDEEPAVQFKTLPGKPITSVQLATAIGSQGDKIFAASGNEVKGYTRKGKVFLTLETALSETITSMYVLGGDLVLCSGRTVTYYRDLQELYSYLCEERVLDVAAFAIPNSTRVRLLVLIANKGAAIIEGGQLVTRASILSGPSRLAVPNLLRTLDIYGFYGAADGSIGLIAYEDSLLSSKCLVEGGGLGSVVCVGWYFNNGAAHLAVGRHDGSVQLYLIDLDNLADKPRLKFTYFCGEPVTSVCGGCIGTDETELMVATFSGRIFGLRSRRLVGSNVLAGVPHDALAARRAKLEAEVLRLEKQTATERDKYQRSTRSLQAGFSAPPLSDIQCELSETASEDWQDVRITSAVPLDMLFIYCKKKLEVQTDSAAVLSICSSQGSAADLLATVRCQAGTRRLWMRMRYVAGNPEVSRGKSETMLIYFLPAGAPRVSRLISIRLPTLPYYSQHGHPNSEKEKRCWCHLNITGSFSVAEMTSWLSEALPGEPPRPSQSISFSRVHSLLRTLVICEYQRGKAVFKSDNVSTIVIIRDLIYNCSIEKSIRVEINCDVPEDYCLKAFENIKELYEIEYQKKRDSILKDAINTLDVNDKSLTDDTLTLCEDYLRVWKTREDIKEAHFDELVACIEGWYVDCRALTMQPGESHNEIVKLRKALQDCSIQLITQILSNDVSN